MAASASWQIVVWTEREEHVMVAAASAAAAVFSGSVNAEKVISGERAR